MEKSIIDMLSMEESAQDATSVALDPIDVFGEKSKNADEAIDYGKGLSQSELLDIAISSVTPMAGSIKAGKGAMSFLKGLFKKSQSQNIAKPNRSEIQRIIRNLEGEEEANQMRKLLKTMKTNPQPTSKSPYQLIDEMENVAISFPERAMEIEKTLLNRFGGDINKLERAITDYYKNIDALKMLKPKPKGMRKVGIRVKD